jgi:hypothetical protein
MFCLYRYNRRLYLQWIHLKASEGRETAKPGLWKYVYCELENLTASGVMCSVLCVCVVCILCTVCVVCIASYKYFNVSGTIRWTLKKSNKKRSLIRVMAVPEIMYGCKSGEGRDELTGFRCYVVRTVHFGMKLYNDQRIAQAFNLCRLIPFGTNI